MSHANLIRTFQDAGNLALEVIGLQTPRGRIGAFLVVFLIGAAMSLDILPWVPNLSVYAALGIPSPSIGLTRAFVQLLNGDMAAAYDRNWLIFPIVAIAALIFVRDLRRIIKH